MKKITIIYGSTTGNTASVANIIKDNLDASVTLSEVTEASEEMIKEADLVLLGSSTWGYGEIQDDFKEYYENMSRDLFEGKKLAVFGCGDFDSFEDVFCEATELIRERAVECGATIVSNNLKINGDPEDNESEIINFAKAL
jgi:flavodoxin I